MAETDIREVGAATTLVALRCRRDGLCPDAAVARMLLGAILLDTEGLSHKKTRPADEEAAGWLTGLSGEQPAALFAALQEQLLAETDLAVLYRRDYRRFPGLCFAVLKIRADVPLDENRLRQLLADDRAAGGCACLAKISRYSGENIHDETYMAAAEPAVREAILSTIVQVSGEHARRCSADTVYIPAAAQHLSRKRLMPLLQKIL